VARLGLDLDLEGMALEVEPERRLGDRELAHLLALGEDRQAPALMVEVLELDLLERALPKPVVEQEPQCDPVSQILCLGEDRPALIVAERGPVDLASPGSLDHERRVAVQPPAHDLELDEVPQARQILVGVAGAAVAVLVLEELLDALRPDRRLEVLDLEVGEVASELVESPLVFAVA
jgi:hypothetical protein